MDSSLIVIPNQPVNLNPYVADDCAPGDEAEYCALYTTGSEIRLQFRQTPCGDTLVCDGAFPVGDDMLEGNGSFTTDPRNIWIGRTDRWSWDAVNGKMVCVDPSGTLSYSYLLWRPTPGTSYRLTFTTSGRTTGSITATCGGVTLTSRSGNSTYAETFAAVNNDPLVFTPSSWDGALDDIACTSVALDCWSIEPSSGWTLDEGRAVHTPGLAGYLKQVDVYTSGIYTLDGYFSVIVTVEEMTAGAVTVQAGDGAVQSISRAGTYTLYFTNTAGTDLTFEATDDFNGVITAVESYQLTTADDFTVTVTNLDHSAIAHQPDKLIYTYKDYVTVMVAIGDPDVVPLPGHYNLPAGCYVIAVIDPCGGSTLWSQCIRVQSAAEYVGDGCQKWIEAKCEGREALGFYFGNGFQLQTLYRFVKFAPTYPVDADDYQYSNGVRSLTYAAREKYYEGLFDFLDETALDTISAAVLCDTFTIDGVEYFVKPENLKPEWDKENWRKLAQARIELRLKQSTIYNTRSNG